ncbi:MAG TPA: lysozyme inhibitor LprI family protein [Rhodocyclaceae bacterium]|jgi:uncharacterized protein YecT (DUF1311 family)
MLHLFQLPVLVAISLVLSLAISLIKDFMRAFFTLLLILISPFCIAAESDTACSYPANDWPDEICLAGTKVSCQAPRNGDEKFLCLSAESSKANNEMARLYQRTLLLFERSNTSEANYTEATKALIESQRAWNQFRTMHCLIPAALNTLITPSRRGQMVISCELDLTKSRIKDLNALQQLP